MLRAFVLAVVGLVLAACAGPAPGEPQGPFVGIDGRPLIMADGTIDNSVVEALTANPAACAKAGGEVRPVCMRGLPMCVVNFSDAGKACKDGKECMGRCLGDSSTPMNQPATGKCAATNDPCGCFQLVENGVAQPTLCAD
jgi:hypothetical protein